MMTNLHVMQIKRNSSLEDLKILTNLLNSLFYCIKIKIEKDVTNFSVNHMKEYTSYCSKAF